MTAIPPCFVYDMVVYFSEGRIFSRIEPGHVNDLFRYLENSPHTFNITARRVFSKQYI